MKGYKSHTFSSESSTEAVTLAEVKAHLYIDNGNTDFDTILTSLTKQVRRFIEDTTAVGLITRTIILYIDYYDEFNLPWGPVTSFTSAEYKTGIGEYETAIANDEYEVENGRFISYVGEASFKNTYVGGFTSATIPDGLKLAFLNEIARRFDNRGDGGVPETNILLDSYKMLDWVM